MKDSQDTINRMIADKTKVSTEEYITALEEHALESFGYLDALLLESTIREQFMLDSNLSFEGYAWESVSDRVKWFYQENFDEDVTEELESFVESAQHNLEIGRAEVAEDSHTCSVEGCENPVMSDRENAEFLSETCDDLTVKVDVQDQYIAHLSHRLMESNSLVCDQVIEVDLLKAYIRDAGLDFTDPAWDTAKQFVIKTYFEHFAQDVVDEVKGLEDKYTKN